MNRSPNIKLATYMDRCEPSAPCDQRGACARYMAEIPLYGATLADYSLYRTLSSPSCPQFLAVADIPAEPEPVREVRPWPTL